MADNVQRYDLGIDLVIYPYARKCGWLLDNHGFDPCNISLVGLTWSYLDKFSLAHTW